MKILGRILFGLVVMFFGLSLFQCTQQSTFTEAIRDKADEAIINNDYTFFKSIFPQHQITDLESINITGDESFNLHAFLVGSQTNSTIIFVVDGYSKTPRPETLKLVVKTNSQEALGFDLVSLGKENWYLQWIHLDKLFQGQVFIEDILDYQIKDGETVLYDFDESTGPLIMANDANIQAYVKKENIAITHPNSYLDITEAILDESISEKGTSKTYKQVFNVTYQSDVEAEVYVVGNFNDYNLDDKTYKLTKNKANYYTGTFDITTDDTDLYYYVVVDGKVVSEAGVAKQYHKTYVSEDTDLKTLNIETVTPVKLNKYQYKVWITLSVYLVVAALSMWVLFFRKKKPRAQYAQNQVQPKEKPQQPKENINLSAITDIQERDSDLQVHEKETVIEDAEIEDIEKESTEAVKED